MHNVEVGGKSTVTQPLISEEQRSRRGSPSINDQAEREHAVEEDQDEGESEDSVTTASWFVWLLTLAAGVSGLLFGYDTGVISSTLVSIHSDLSSHALTTLDKSLITSATSFFALVASPCTGVLADRLGRKPVLLLASCLFVTGALAQAVSTTVWTMIVGRGIVGLAVGSASFIAPLYISELAPRKLRGALVTVEVLFITGGQVVAYIVGWLFSTMPAGWRWMVGLGAVPAIVQMAMLIAMSETPRWLVKVGRPAEAEEVLRKIYGGGAGRAKIIQSVLRAVQQEQEEEENAQMLDEDNDEHLKPRLYFQGIVGSSFNELFANHANRRALTIACMLQGFQQLCGFNSLMYFSATIFALVGFTSPTLTSLTIALTNFLFTLLAFSTIDSIGRRRTLLVSIPFMVLGLLLCALAFAFLKLDVRQAADAASDPALLASPIWSNTLILSLIIYVAAYALGLGSVPWQQAELFPLSVRSVGSGLATSTNWFANTIVGLTFLPMMEALTPSMTFAIYAVVCAVAWISCWCIYPETMGLSLEEVSALLKEGWGVAGRDERNKLVRRRDIDEHGHPFE